MPSPDRGASPRSRRNICGTPRRNRGRVIDYRDWQIPLGRRFRALKLWMVIRHYGVEGLRAYIREHIRIAALFESWVRADERFEVVAPRTTSLVCFRLRPRAGEQPADTDARNRRLLEKLNDSGEMYLTHTALLEVRPARADTGAGARGSIWEKPVCPAHGDRCDANP